MITRALSRAECRKDLRDNWDNPTSEICFLGIDKLYHHYNGLISRNEIERILSSFESFTLQRQERRPNGRFDGFSMPRHIDNIIEVDSFDVTELSEENMGACHILCGINTFSKRLFAIPMLKRDGKSGLAAIKEIFRRARSLPDYLVSDKVFAKTNPDCLQLVFFCFFFHFGTENRTRSKTLSQGGECSSKLIQDYLKSRGVGPIIVTGRHKAASVERVQKTLQQKIYTFMNEKQTKSFINVLPDLVFTYNSSRHSTTKW